MRYRPYTMPEMKMAFKFQVLGVGLATTRSLDRAIMAPSLNTASNTISRVGKYLQKKPLVWVIEEDCYAINLHLCCATCYISKFLFDIIQLPAETAMPQTNRQNSQQSLTSNLAARCQDGQQLFVHVTECKESSSKHQQMLCSKENLK